MTKLKNIIRPHIAQLKPYSTARDEFQGEASIFLDANESPYSPQFASISDGISLNRYPDPYSTELRKLLAERTGLQPECCLLTNGSDEAIELLIHACVTPDTDSILICPPTYGMYKVAAAGHDLSVVECPLLENFQLDVPSILALHTENLVQKRIKICIFCSPNNPTGNLLRRDDICRIVEETDALVVVDEAYIDFAGLESSLIPLTSQYENLLVLQTFSKAWGLAGLRAGKLFSSRELIQALLKIKQPYNVNSLTQKLVAESLRNPEEKNKYLEQNLNERRELSAKLQQLVIVERVLPSDANFILVQFTQAERVFSYLLNKGIVVRNRGKEPGCADCLRITVGTPEENQQLLNALKDYQ